MPQTLGPLFSVGLAFRADLYRPLLGSLSSGAAGPGVSCPHHDAEHRGGDGDEDGNKRNRDDRGHFGWLPVQHITWIVSGVARLKGISLD